MAVSTEATVRTVLVELIQAVSHELGFDEESGNVREYPIEMHHDERTSAYLKATVDGKQVARAIAVDVRGHDEPFALKRVPIRTYAIRILFYYAKGQDGQAYIDMINHARVVRGELNDIMPTLSGTVSRIVSATPLAIEEIERLDFGKLLVGTLAITAERTAPDF